VALFPRRVALASKVDFQWLCPTAAIVLCEDCSTSVGNDCKIPLRLCLLHHDYCGRLNNAIQQIEYFQSWKTALTIGFADKKGFAVESSYPQTKLRVSCEPRALSRNVNDLPLGS
jgi:hypothetical protein